MPTAPPFQWSDLARRSGEVGEALDEFGEVSVTRGGVVLRLAPAIADPAVTALRDLSRLLAALVSNDQPDHVVMVLNAAWPWTRALPHDDVLELAREVGGVAEMSESLDTWRPLLDTIADWRRTARAWASGARPADIPMPAATPVRRP
jgi:hypothetical protein